MGTFNVISLPYFPKAFRCFQLYVIQFNGKVNRKQINPLEGMTNYKISGHLGYDRFEYGQLRKAGANNVRHVKTSNHELTQD